MIVVALDTEFTPFTDTCKAPPLACVTWAELGGGAGLLHHADPCLRPELVDWLTSACIVGHSIATDMCVILAHFPELVSLVFKAYVEGRILDLRLAQKLADISDGSHEAPWHMHNGEHYTLASIHWRHCRKQLEKDKWRLLYGELRAYPLELWHDGARKYATDDAIATLETWAAVVAKYGDGGPWWAPAGIIADVVRQSQHAFALQLMKCHGVRTDPEIVAQVKKLIEAKHGELGRTLLSAGLLRVEAKGLVKCTKVAKARMLAAKGPKRLTKTGFERQKKGMPAPLEAYISTDKEACADSGDEILEAYAAYSSLGTKLSGQFPYLEMGRVHSTFEPLRETGRTACGDPYNWQNLPRGKKGILGERECVIPRAGFKFGINDYGGLELCTGAQMNIDHFGYSEMSKVLNHPTRNDAHLDFAATLLRRSYDEILPLKFAKDPVVTSTRDVAKSCNFGFGGGMGPARFIGTCKAQGLVISLARATELHAAWPQRWTEFQRHFAWVRQMTRGGPARVKHLRVNRWRGGLDYCELSNTLFQSLGADVAKDALFRVVREMYDPACASILFGSRAVLFVHDEIVSEFPEHIAHECAVRQTEIMNQVAREYLPDCPTKTEPTLANRWSKSAVEIYGPDGRLVSWEHPAIGKAA